MDKFKLGGSISLTYRTDNMISKILARSLKDKFLIGVRTTTLEWDEVIIGFIESIDDSYFTLKEIDEYGKFIGNTILSFDDIVHLEYSDRYQRRLNFIYENGMNLNPDNRTTIWKKQDALLPYFELTKKRQNIVTLYLDEDNYSTGKIIDYDEESIFIHMIGSDGNEDGFSCYRIENIIGLRYDGIEEQKIELLYKNRDKF